MITRLPPAILAVAASFAQTLDRTKPPETPPLAPYKLPASAESKLPNGLGIAPATAEYPKPTRMSVLEVIPAPKESSK